TIRFELPEAAYVRLAVFNLLGEEVVQLVDDQRQAGVYDQQFDASGLASGTYFYRLEVQKSGGDGRSFVQVRKMTILR
ncbi:MAG: Por secretion system C-terminal sorting protein, partial [Bacteroidetes bacterium]|nr:Por secretion system C-terminal sorting protein [Bacteroidota bacterium]